MKLRELRQLIDKIDPSKDSYEVYIVGENESYSEIASKYTVDNETKDISIFIKDNIEFVC